MKENLLGQEVELRKLTVGDMFKLKDILEQDEATQMFNIVSLALVNPKMTAEEVYNIDMKYMNDLTKIVEIATNQE